MESYKQGASDSRAIEHLFKIGIIRNILKDVHGGDYPNNDFKFVNDSEGKVELTDKAKRIFKMLEIEM
jgi:hypothetical protein